VYKPVTIPFDHSEKHFSLIADFFDKCSVYGYKNTTSCKEIRLKELTPPHGNLWITLFKNKVEGIHGLQPLFDYKKNCYRVLTRNCVFPIINQITSPKGLTKNYLSRSYSLRIVLQYQLDWLSSRFENFIPILTVNSPSKKDDSAGKSFASYARIFPLLEKQGILTKLEKDYFLYNCEQDIYMLNTLSYYSALKEIQEK